MATARALIPPVFKSFKGHYRAQSRSIATLIPTSTARPSLLQYHARTASLPFLNNVLFRPTFRRPYVSVDLGPTPKKERAGFFRWTWRLTKLAALGGAGYLTWNIWDMRHPPDQIDADPTKKTLVILGIDGASKVLISLQLT